MSRPLPAWVADRALTPLWTTIRTRLEGNGVEPTGRVRVVLADRTQRHAVGDLLGRSLTGPRTQIDLAELDRRLRQRSGVGGLVEVLTALQGEPPRDRRAERAAGAAGREAPLILAQRLVADNWGSTWAAGLRRTGLLTNRPDAERVVTDAATVLRVLTAPERLFGTAPMRTEPSGTEPSGTEPSGTEPSGTEPSGTEPSGTEPSGTEPAYPEPTDTRPATSRVELAAQLLGDAHALDEDRLVHHVVLRGLAAAAGVPVPATSSERRALWESAGIAPDLVSRTCLTWRLRRTDDPAHVTAWDLRRHPTLGTAPAIGPRGGTVLVCENPRVLEAIAEQGTSGWPVVCTSGEANTVVTALLGRLAESGATLLYHGDFDWPGIAIANRLIARFGVTPWLMAATDYSAAFRADAPRLAGPPVDPSWDPELGPTMRSLGTAVHEESVLSSMLAALAVAASR